MSNKHQKFLKEFAWDKAKSYGDQLQKLPRSDWRKIDRDTTTATRLDVWVNKDFIVQVFDDNGFIRISVNRTEIKRFTKKNHPIWKAAITWNQLQNIKNEIGFANHWMIELYPPVNEVINVANMRHLWLFDNSLNIGWVHDKANTN